MSLANFDYLLDPPDPCTDFYCMLCGTMKPLDDLAPQARAQYDYAVCTRCWEEVNEPPECEHEFLSGCCGAPEHPHFPEFCGKCRDHAIFECECGQARQK